MKRSLLFISVAAMLSACGGSDGDNNDSPSPGPTNKAPNVVLNDYQKQINLGDALVLDASRSVDPEGDELTFQWSIIEKPSSSGLALIDNSTPAISMAPDIAGSYIFSVKVCDAEPVCTTKQLDTVVAKAPLPPANTPATPIFELNAAYPLGDTVKLDASKSYDADGDEITYQWLLKQKPAGSQAQLSSVDTVISSITPDVAGQYEIGLVADDGKGEGVSQTIHGFEATKANLPPVANAGDDMVTNPNILIQLNGRDSYDPDGSSVSYAWRVAEQPELANVTIKEPNIASPSVQLTVPGIYRFELAVTDASGATTQDTVQVEVNKENVPPVAVPGAAQSVIVGDLVQLNGSQSYDPDGDAITYQWAFASKPGGSSAPLTNANQVNPSFTADVAGDYVVTLTVSDGRSARLSATATVRISAETQNAKPVAAISAEKVVGLNKAVMLDGTASSDADGDALTYSWKLVSKPAISAAFLRDAYSATASFTPDEAGVYVAELVVSDRSENSDPIRVSIEAIKVINPLPAGSGVMIKSTYFYAIDEGSGNVTLNSYSSACPNISAMDMTPDGKLMGVYQWTTGLWEMDPYQPLCMKVGDVPRPDIVYTGMAIDASGAIYVSDSQMLRQLDRDGSLLQEYPYTGHISGVKGIDFASNGKLYGYTYFNGGELVEIDPRSGVTTLVAKMALPPEITIHDFYDIDIDEDDILRVSCGATSQIYRYDLTGKLLSSQPIAALPESGGFKAISYVK